MKVDNAILSPSHQVGNLTEDGGQWFVLCDALERPQGSGEPMASRQEIETLAVEAISEYLRTAPRPLSGTVLKEAVEAAHQRIRLACGEEPVKPVASIVVVAEEKNEEGQSHYLVAGAGDVRVYGVGGDAVELAFRDPVAAASKEKRQSAVTNRLGTSDELKVNHLQFDAATYEALLVLTYDAYIGVSEDELQQLAGSGRLLGQRVAKLCPDGALTSSKQAWVISSKRPSRLLGRAPAMAALAGVAVIAIVGVTALVRHDSPPPVEGIAAPTELAPTVPSRTLGRPVEAENQDEVLAQILEARVAPVDRELVVEALPPSKLAQADTPFQGQMVEIELMLEAELAAQENLLEAQKLEMQTLRAELEEHNRLRADFLSLSDLLAEETVRIAEMECALERRQDDLIGAMEAIASQGAVIADLEDQMAVARVEGEDLRTQQHDLFEQSQELRIALSEKEAAFDGLLAEATALEAMTSEQEAELAVLREREQLITAQENQIALLEVVAQEHLAAIGLLEDGNGALIDQVQYLANLNQEHEAIQLVSEEQARVAAVVEADLQKARQENQFLNGVIADLREIEREQQAKVEEVMTARVELSDQLMATTRRYEATLLEKEQLLTKVSELEDVQQLYHKERGLREDKEEMLARVATNLDGWRSAVSSLEHSRTNLSKELAEIRAYQEAVSEAWKEADHHTAHVQEQAPQKKGVTRIHLVSPGETIETIALRYYGTAAGADAILEANRDSLTATGTTRVGTALVIP